MAVSSLKNENANTYINLKENQIPGATLPRKNVEECTVPQLKRWLECRGAKVGGNKPELIKRVTDYVENGLDLQYLRDPDGGKNITLQQVNSIENIKESFPVDGFSENLDELPVVQYGILWKYMVESVDAKRQLSTAKPLVKGFNFYKSGHVLNLTACSKEQKWYIKSSVKPSMKKQSVYSCFIIMRSNGEINRAYCGCPAGIDGRCNHVSATLFALEEYSRTKQNQDQPVSQTSKPCTWNIPRKRKGELLPISKMKFRKHEHGKSKNDRHPEVDPDKDIRAPHQRKFTDQKLSDLLASVKLVQEETGQIIGLSHILPLTSAECTVSTKASFSKPEISKCSSSQEMSATSSLPSKEELLNKCNTIKCQLFVTNKQAAIIEEKTRNQSNDSLWYEQRKHRITSSKSYRCAVLKESTSPTKAIQEVLQYKQVIPTKAMKEGLSKEPEILEDYILAMNTMGHEEIRVAKSGLIISKSHGFLASSPDGLVHDPSHQPSEGLLEMKFIQMEADETIQESLIRKRICVKKDDIIQVNPKHSYYYQMQHQMFTSTCLWVDFVVKGSLSSQLFIQRVTFDNVFWEEVLPKLVHFFDKYMLPEIFFPRVKHGLPRLLIC